MKKVREINWECRSKWSDVLNKEYKVISEWVKNKYYDLIDKNEMIDLESLYILTREEEYYRVQFKIRAMFGKTIIGSRYVLETVPYTDLIKINSEILRIRKN